MVSGAFPGITFYRNVTCAAGAKFTITSTGSASFQCPVSFSDDLSVPDGTIVTPAQLGYLSGASSNIQSQLSGKQPTITGAASTVLVNTFESIDVNKHGKDYEFNS